MQAPDFDIPAVWPERYVVGVWYLLPFCLYLPNDHYEVRMPALNEGRPALIQLDKRSRTPEARFALLPPGRGEMWRDRWGRYRYSTAVVYMPYSDAADGDLKKMLEFFPEGAYLSYALDYVNRLLRVYRFVTADYYIPTLAMEDVDLYFGVAIADTGATRLRAVWTPKGRGEPGVNLLPDKTAEQVGEIKEMLRTGGPVPAAEELLMSARDLLDTASARLAVLEAQTAFELVVNRLVAQHYRDDGYSERQIEDKLLRCGFKNLLRDHLSAKVKPFDAGMPVHDNYWAETYVPRNGLVHGTRTHITEAEAERAVRRVEEALEYLTGRPHDKIWPPERPGLDLAS